MNKKTKNFTSTYPRLAHSFYQRSDTIRQTRQLLGKVLVSKIDGDTTAGLITEVEAYCGTTDKACHAYGGRRTKRTEMLYQEGGSIYVYLCYGIHHLFNVVVHKEGMPHAILVRAVEPLEGLDTMMERRGLDKLEYRLTRGPGSMSKAMGFDTKKHNGLRLDSGEIWIEDRGISLKRQQIAMGPRIGVDYAGEDAKLPYRFWIKDSPWVS